jgi:hypothetical protein
VRNSRRQLRSLDPGARYLNAGCGPKPLSDFINLDWKWRPEIELCWDLTKALPLKSGSLDGVYSEHCLEHSLEKTRSRSCASSIASYDPVRSCVSLCPTWNFS